MKTYNIKKISKVDESQLFDFYTKVYSNVKKSFKINMKWHYRIGYNDFEPIVIIVGDKIIGHAGLIPGEVEAQNQKHKVIWFTDLIILPEYRKKGYGKILIQEWMKICPNQITFCNNSSLRVFKKLDWKHDFSTKRNIYPINYFNITPVLKSFGLNIGNNLIRYFLKKKLNNRKLVTPVKISETHIQDLVESSQIIEKNKAVVVRDENWFRWRLIETPYKDSIFFFEDKGKFIVAHIFYQNNLKRLNILYSNVVNNEKDILDLVVKWSIENQVDFIWYLTSNLRSTNRLFSLIFKKKINFAFNSSNMILSKFLEHGLSNAHGIDSDIDYIVRDR